MSIWELKPQTSRRSVTLLLTRSGPVWDRRACQLWDADEAARAPPYPVSLVVAVVVDASVDGFLIGLASANGTRANAGLVLAVALTIEMGFLGARRTGPNRHRGAWRRHAARARSRCPPRPKGGEEREREPLGALPHRHPAPSNPFAAGLTFASTMRKQPRLFALPSVLLPPLMLLLGAAGGACASAALAAQPALHVALVSFGAAALLYLVPAPRGKRGPRRPHKCLPAWRWPVGVGRSAPA